MGDREDGIARTEHPNAELIRSRCLRQDVREPSVVLCQSGLHDKEILIRGVCHEPFAVNLGPVFICRLSALGASGLLLCGYGGTAVPGVLHAHVGQSLLPEHMVPSGVLTTSAEPTACAPERLAFMLTVVGALVLLTRRLPRAQNETTVVPSSVAVLSSFNGREASGKRAEKEGGRHPEGELRGASPGAVGCGLGLDDGIVYTLLGVRLAQTGLRGDETREVGFVGGRRICVVVEAGCPEPRRLRPHIVSPRGGNRRGSVRASSEQAIHEDTRRIRTLRRMRGRGAYPGRGPADNMGCSGPESACAQDGREGPRDKSVRGVTEENFAWRRG